MISLCCRMMRCTVLFYSVISSAVHNCYILKYTALCCADLIAQKELIISGQNTNGLRMFRKLKFMEYLRYI